MPAIGHVTKQKDGSYKGDLKTLAISAPLSIVPNTNKTGDSQPDFKIFTHGNAEIGAAWIRTGRESGADYISLSLADPAFGKLYANLGRAAGQDDPDVFAIIWNADD